MQKARVSSGDLQLPERIRCYCEMRTVSKSSHPAIEVCSNCAHCAFSRSLRKQARCTKHPREYFELDGHCEDFQLSERLKGLGSGVNSSESGASTHGQAGRGGNGKPRFYDSAKICMWRDCAPSSRRAASPIKT